MKKIRVIGRFIMRLISAIRLAIPSSAADALLPMQPMQLQTAAAGAEISRGSVRVNPDFHDTGPFKAVLADKWHRYIRDGTYRQGTVPHVTTDKTMDQRRAIQDTGYK